MKHSASNYTSSVLRKVTLIDVHAMHSLFCECLHNTSYSLAYLWVIELCDWLRHWCIVAKYSVDRTGFFCVRSYHKGQMKIHICLWKRMGCYT